MQVVGNERSLKNWKVLRYFRWNKSDLKDGRRDGESNKAFPLTPPSPPGERENMRTLRQGSGNVDFDPTHRSSAPRQLDHHRHDRTPWRTRPFQMCRVVLPLPWGESGVRGKGLACRLQLSFQPLAPVSIPPKIARNQLEYPLWMMRKPPIPVWNNPHRRRVVCS